MLGQGHKFSRELCETCHGTTRFPGAEWMYCTTCKATGWKHPEVARILGRRPAVFSDPRYTMLNGHESGRNPEYEVEHRCPELIRHQYETCPDFKEGWESIIDGRDVIIRFGGYWWLVCGDTAAIHIQCCPFCGRGIEQETGPYLGSGSYR